LSVRPWVTSVCARKHTVGVIVTMYAACLLLLAAALPSAAAQTVCATNNECIRARLCTDPALPVPRCAGRQCTCQPNPAIFNLSPPSAFAPIAFAAVDQDPTSLQTIKFSIFTIMKLDDQQAQGNTPLLPTGNTALVDSAKTTGTVKNTAQLISDLLAKELPSGKTQPDTYNLPDFKIVKATIIRTIEDNSNAVFGTLREREMKLDLSVKRKDAAASASVPELKTAITKLKHKKWTYMVSGDHQFPANISKVTFAGMGDPLKYNNFMDNTAYFEEVVKGFKGAHDLFETYKEYAKEGNLFGFEARMKSLMADIKSLDDTTAAYLKKRGANVEVSTPKKHEFCIEALKYRVDTRLPGTTTPATETPFPKPTAFDGGDTKADYHMCICAYKTTSIVTDGGDNIKDKRCKRNSADLIQTDPAPATGVAFDNKFLQKGIAMLYDANLVVSYLKMRVKHVQETALTDDNKDYASNRFALKKLTEPLDKITTRLNNDYQRLVDFLRNTSGPSGDSQVGYKVGERQLDDNYRREYSVKN